ncbi:MAG: nitrous oxide reductase family maturation protein NosD [Candidatus Thorarchaeota archaeon]
MNSVIINKPRLVALMLIFGFSFYFYSNQGIYSGNENGYIITNKGPVLKRAGFWETGPISITDDNPASNWLMTAATYDWCSGSGTIEDPYLIENVTINGGGANLCISVSNSKVPFIIRNCTVYNFNKRGIGLSNTENGRIINNTIYGGSSVGDPCYGIHLRNSSSNIVTRNDITNMNGPSQYDSGLCIEAYGGEEYGDNCLNNNVSNNYIYDIDCGIRLTAAFWSVDDKCNHNYIIGNRIENSKYKGIILQSQSGTCNYNVVRDNNINNSGSDGIYLSRGGTIGPCNYNMIFNNSVSNSGENGIYISGEYNDIYDNTSFNNTQNGISVEKYDENIIAANFLMNNTLYGVLIETTSNDNTIFNNTFIGNTVNALDSGTGNQWDYSSLGNYWDDYGGIDANDDGIGDTPYDVPPVGESVDNYPIWDDGDDLAPEIIINSPSMNDAVGLTAPDFEIAINDASPINTTWYTIDGGINNYTFSGLTETINQTAWDNKGPEELMTLRFYANDSLGHVGFKDITIWKDVVAPQITINAPTSNQLCGVEAPTFSLTIVEPNILSTLYSFNGRPNITSGIQAEWDNIGNGTVLITISVLDKAGNVNSSEITVRKDAYIPEIIVHSPLSGETFGTTPPTFNISIIEEDLESMWYTIEHIAGTFPLSELTGTIDQDAWSDVPEEEITLIFYAQDRAGNIGTETITVIKAIPKSTAAISGYNIFILLGILSIAFIIVNKKTMKK